MTLKNKYYTLALTLLFFALSCTQGFVFKKTIDLKNGWEKDQTLKFSFKNKEDSNTKTFMFIVRNDNDYPFRNLHLITKITGPNLLIRRDTIEYEMAQLDGKWLGSGIGKVKESLLLFPENISLSQKGNYTISIRHGMRKDTLFGIKSIGIASK